MKIDKAKYIVVIAILVVCGLLVLKIEQVKAKVLDRTSSGIQFDKLPLRFGSWQGSDAQIDQQLYDMLGTKDVLIRQYKDGEGNVVDLAVVYSAENRQSFHPPELCFLGGGVELTEKTHEVIALGEGENLSVNKLLMQIKLQGDSDRYEKAVAWYWFSAGSRFIADFYKQQAYVILGALKGRGIRGSLIRVSAWGKSQDLEDRAKAFIKQAAPYLKKVL